MSNRLIPFLLAPMLLVGCQAQLQALGWSEKDFPNLVKYADPVARVSR
jgi:hypothetical protein